MAEANQPGGDLGSVGESARARDSWIYRASGLEFASIAAAVTLLLFSLGSWLDWLAMDQVLPRYAMVLADAAVAGLAGLLVYRVLQEARRRHQEMLRHMEVIAEMNHHIRNALQVIAYHNVGGAHGEKAVAQVQSAVERIEWVLRDVLPEKPKPEDKPPQP